MKNLAIARLQDLHLAHALPHAWLFVSANLAAGLHTAQTFAQWLLCTNKVQHEACGVCKACKLFFNGVHPDYCYVTTPENKQNIVIDDVRHILEFATVKPQISSSKVVLIYPAQAMHAQSANAILKSLEEPCSDTIYILVASHKELLAKTIISRCHIFNIPNAPLVDTAVLEHVQSMYTDLQALWLNKSVTSSQIAESWIKHAPVAVLYWFEILLTDMLRFKYTANTRFAKAWCLEQEKLCSALSHHKLWTILEQLRQAQYLLGHNHKPNVQLLLENMLLL